MLAKLGNYLSTSWHTKNVYKEHSTDYTLAGSQCRQKKKRIGKRYRFLQFWQLHIGRKQQKWKGKKINSERYRKWVFLLSWKRKFTFLYSFYVTNLIFCFFENFGTFRFSYLFAEWMDAFFDSKIKCKNVHKRRYKKMSHCSNGIHRRRLTAGEASPAQINENFWEERNHHCMCM